LGLQALKSIMLRMNAENLFMNLLRFIMLELL
jgi:hypothetical protein